MHSIEVKTAYEYLRDPEWAKHMDPAWTEDFIRIYRSTAWVPDTETAYKNIADTLYEVFGAKEVFIHLLDSDKKLFSRCASKITEKPLPGQFDATWDVGLGRSSSLITDRTLQVLDYAHPHKDDVLPYDERRYAICIPLVSGDSTLGICTAIFYECCEWDCWKLGYFAIIGLIIGSAIYRLHVTESAAELAVLKERRRLSSEIHDNVVQRIHAVSLNAAAALASYEEGDMESLESDLTRLEENCKNAVKTFRDEMLSLKTPGESERVNNLIEGFEKMLRNFETNWGIETELKIKAVHNPITASTLSSLQLTRILNEGLSNVLRHSGATKLTVSITEDGKHLVMRIEDNGHGFNVEAVPENHWGIQIMKERAFAMRASFDIRSNENGTVITVDVPRH